MTTPVCRSHQDGPHSVLHRYPCILLLSYVAKTSVYETQKSCGTSEPASPKISVYTSAVILLRLRIGAKPRFALTADISSAILTKKVQCFRTPWNAMERRPTNTPTDALAKPAGACISDSVTEAMETTPKIRSAYRPVVLSKIDARTKQAPHARDTGRADRSRRWQSVRGTGMHDRARRPTHAAHRGYDTQGLLARLVAAWRGG
jgi:hypothetical protein